MKCIECDTTTVEPVVEFENQTFDTQKGTKPIGLCSKCEIIKNNTAVFGAIKVSSSTAEIARKIFGKKV